MAANTFAKVTTPLGEDTLQLAGIQGHEALGRLFEYEIDLYSLDSSIALTDIVGQPITVRIEVDENKYRYINGIATRFSLSGASDRYTLYRLTLRPWLWLLTRTADCRIFQDDTIPDVIMAVFRELGFSDFEPSFSRSYRKWEYLCQYRESTFNFVSRLMEQEGIYYYFKHEDGKHTLCLTDGYSGHETQPGYEQVPFYPPQSNERRERDHIDGWRLTQEIQPSRFALNDFDFKKPKAALLAVVNAPGGTQDPNEVYDYPGEYDEAADGDTYNRLRMEQAMSQYEIVEGQGNARGLVAGALFSLTAFPRDDQNREYLLTSTAITLDTGALESTQGGSPKVNYRVSFQGIEAQTPFRPSRETRKPEITGPQTAIVTGGEADEIYTDRFGRVKVKFHWDRSPEKSALSSCWIRVSQAWAGANWGAIHIPRVGQEVIVEFLEGDPDRPIVTGRVYNANSMPPYALPTNKTQSGIKSRSTIGGSGANFNELRFEDKKGDEQVYMQAEKNMDTLVKNDQTLTVGANRTKSIGGDETTTVDKNRTETVTLNETITISGNRLEKVIGTETITISGNRTETVMSAELINILLARMTNIGLGDNLNVGGARMVNVVGLDSTVVGAAQTIAVGAMRSVDVKGAQTTDIGGPETIKIGAGQTVTITGAQTVSVSADQSTKVDGSSATKAGKTIVVDAGDSVTIKTGKASVTMSSSGDIVLKGANITFQASGHVRTKASGDVSTKASGKVKTKGTQIGEN